MRGKKPKRNPYRLHRLALRPILPEATQKEKAQACQEVAEIDEPELLAFLELHGLAAMWDKMLDEEKIVEHFTKDFRTSLHQNRMHTTAAYLIQQNKLRSIKEILDQAIIPHVVYKGADIRERYYDVPSLRSAVDIDVLIPDEQKIQAIKAFKQRGFDFYARTGNISHEASLEKGNTSIDLHWDIMRPGRTRAPMTERLLSTRRDYGTHWGMSDEANLFIMLVHPVFTKYTTTPQAALMRTVDLAKILERRNWELEKVIQLLDDAGLKTAAWITLRWFSLLTESTLADEALNALKPGKLRQKYLNRWLEDNLASRLIEKPIYIQLGFTLPAHDKPKDAVRAIRMQQAAARSAAEDLRQIEREIG